MKDVFRLRQSQTVLEDVKYFFSLQRQKPVFMYYNSWYRPRKKAKKKVDKLIAQITKEDFLKWLEMDKKRAKKK